MIDSRFYRHHGPVELASIAGELFCHEEFLSGNSVSSVCGLDDGAVGDLTYITSKALLSKLATVRAKLCFCNEEYEGDVKEAGLIPLVSRHPRGDFSVVLSHLYSRKTFDPEGEAIAESIRRGKNSQIMPGAVIGAEVDLGDNVYIGPNAVIGPGVIIGEGSHIGAGALVQCADIGAHCRISAGAIIGGDGFGTAPAAQGITDIPHIGRVIIGDYVTIGYNTTVDRGMLGDTQIGAHTKIDNLVQIGHNVKLGQRVLIAGHCGISGSVIVGDDVKMGGRVGIADHITIGKGATLAAAAAVMKDVPEGELWSGYPAKPLRQHMREIAILNKMVKGKRP